MIQNGIPRVDQLGPDPEPLPPRFETLLALHVDEARRPAGRRAEVEAVIVSVAAAPAAPATLPALAA